MRSRLSLVILLSIAAPFVVPSPAEAIRFRPPARKKATAVKEKRPGPGELAPGKANKRRGLSGIFRRKGAAGKESARSREGARVRLGRAVTKARRAVTFDRLVRTQIGLMKFGSTVTLGLSLATGRPSVIAMAGVMTAMSYALHPAMKLAERLGERIAARYDQRLANRLGP